MRPTVSPLLFNPKEENKDNEEVFVVILSIDSPLVFLRHGETLLRDELPQLHGERPHGGRPQLLQVPRLEEDGGREGGRGHPAAADGLGGRREESQHHLQLRPRVHEGLLQALPHG